MSRIALYAPIGAGMAAAFGLWLAMAGILPGAMGPAAATGTTVETATAEDEDVPTPPFIVAERAAELAAALEGAPYVHKGGPGPALFLVSFRSCPACIAFEAAEMARLEAAGVDLRFIVYARADRDGKPRSKPEERAIVAELALNRNYALLDAWLAVGPEEYYQSADLPPAAESAPERIAAVEAGRALVNQLADIAEANGQDLAIPALFWQDAGVWHGLIGYDEETFAPVRERLSTIAAGRP